MSKRVVGHFRFLQAFRQNRFRLVLGIPFSRSFNIPLPIIEKVNLHSDVRSERI